jgi:hypothetical protein
VSRDKCSLDLFWLKDDSLLDADNLPDPDVIAGEIAEDLRVALRGAPQLVTQVYTIGASTPSWVESPPWGRAASTNPIGRRPGTSSEWVTVRFAASTAAPKEARLNRRCAGKESTPSTEEASLESAV